MIEAAEQLDAANWLLDRYEQIEKPFRQRRCTAKTLRDHVTSCRKFGEWLTDSDAGREIVQNAVRFDKPLGEILSENIALFDGFASFLITEKRLAPHTVASHQRHVKMIFDRGVKLDHWRRVIAEPMTLTELSRLRAVERPETAAIDSRRIPTADEIRRMIIAAKAAIYPYGKTIAPRFWRGWLRFCALYGPRSQDIVAHEDGKTGIFPEHVTFETRCPDLDVGELHNPHGWIRYPIRKSLLKGKIATITLPLHRHAKDWLKFFLSLDHVTPAEPIFKSDKPGSGRLVGTSIGRSRRKILDRANVDSNIRESEGTGGKIAIRKFAANTWSEHVLANGGDHTLAGDVENYILHHAAITTKDRHYIDVKRKVLPVLCRLLPTYPLPERRKAKP